MHSIIPIYGVELIIEIIEELIGLGVSVCSNLFINHASCIPSLSCLPYFIPSLYASFSNSQDI